MKCQNCPYWGFSSSERLRRTQTWMDCGYVIGTLEPKLFQCRGIGQRDFRIPFDPHEVKYFKFDANFLSLYKSVTKRSQPEGVKIHDVRAKDTTFIMNDEGKISVDIRPVTLRYFRTHKNYECDLYRRDDEEL